MITRTAQISIKTNAEEAMEGMRKLNNSLEEGSKDAIANEVAIRDLADAQHKLKLAEEALTQSTGHTATALANMESNLAKAKLAVVEKTDKLKSLADAQIKGTSAIKTNSEAVFANGGFMALASSLTGGYAQIVKDSVEGSRVFTGTLSLQSMAQAAYATVVGTSTGAMKLFRLALASTGIGLLVVGIGLLIANFETVSKWVTSVMEKFGGWRNVLMFIAPPIYLIIKALEALGIMESEADEKNRKLFEEKRKRAIIEGRELDKRRGQINDYFDFEIAKAQASGKNTVQLERLKRDAIMKTLVAYNELNRALISAGKQEGDTIEDWNKRVKEWNANQAAMKKLKQDQVISDLTEEKKANDKTAEARKKANDKAVKDAEDEAKNKADEKQKQDDAYKSMQEKFEKEIQDLQDITTQQKLDRQKARDLEEINALKGKTAEEIKILKDALDQKYKIKQKELDDIAAAQTAQNQKDVQALIAKSVQEKSLDKAKTLEEVEEVRFRNAQKLNQQMLDDMLAAQAKGATDEQVRLIEENYKILKDEQNTAANEKANEIKTTENEEKIKLEKAKYDALATIAQGGEAIMTGLIEMGVKKSKATEAAQKSFALAQIGIDSAMAFSKMMAGTEASAAAAASTAGPAAPAVYLSTKIAFYASGIAQIMANVVKAKKLLSSGGSGGGGGATATASAGGGAVARPAVSFQNTPQGQISETINENSAARNPVPIRLEVSSNEITTAQQRDEDNRNSARYN